MIRLTKEQVLYLHTEMIRETGGSDGLRDEGMLDSALAAPFQSFDGYTPYPSLQQRPQGWAAVWWRTTLL